MSCLLCDRKKAIDDSQYPYLVHEFKNSYLVLGEHQFYKGYCILISKTHYREMTDMPLQESHEFYDEMLITSKFIEKSFNPKKMNMCSLGNVVDHIHWHFFPRYADDADFKNPPWLQMDQFETARLLPDERDKLLEKMKIDFKNFQALSDQC